ncbi:MAG TPA: metal-dependent hydrolase [Vicinamibacterales bacterium]|nr:metal-dependent hydrolase [Vicinamibacterales bacterium]
MSHAMAAVTIAAAMMPRSSYRAWAVVGVVCATVPDLDAVPRLVGRGDLAILGGHRGITHSILFAVATAGFVTLGASQSLGASRFRIFSCLALATLSHGILDAFTDYGSGVGVAFLSPFSEHRFNAPWQPIKGEFSELLLCLLPLVLMTAAALHVRKLAVGIPFRESPVQLRLQTLESQPPDTPLPPTAVAPLIETAGDRPRRAWTRAASNDPYTE